VSQDKWDKTRLILRDMKDRLDAGGVFVHKELESQRGFLIYVVRTYSAMKPYLRGIHATLDSWRPDRDAEGWKLPPGRRSRKRKRTGAREGQGRAEESFDPDLDPLVSEAARFGRPESTLVNQRPPRTVRAVPRLKDDLDALLKLTAHEEPTRRRARPKKRVTVCYGFGDASKPGYGSSILVEGVGLIWRSGLWDWSIREEMSSNYKELRNLVEALYEAADEGHLQDVEIWMFTDNSTAEAAYFKGTSKSRRLFELVLRLRQLEMKTGARIFLVHVAGTRMIAQGGDGLSRGDQNTGVMAGRDMLSYIPLHLSAVDWSPQLTQWAFSWASAPGGSHPFSVVTPSEWPRAHPSGGTFLWFPPPAGASAAVEWLALSAHKRSASVHVVLIPRLMTAWWFKVLNKASDLIFTVPVGAPMWETDQHEPLICAIVLPLSRREPWRAKGTERAARVLRSLQGVWADDYERAGSFLREFLGEARDLAAV